MKRFKYAIPLIILIICSMIIFLSPTVFPYKENDAWNELLALEPTVSMVQLKEKGYVDVSEILDSPNDKITSFLKDASQKKHCVLRIASISEGKLCAKILMYNEQLNVIKSWTMYPNQQQAESPGKCFRTEVFETEEGNIRTIFLKNIPNPSLPASLPQPLSDEKLYSYKIH